MCRMRLYSLSGVEHIEGNVPDKTTDWRESCAITLMMTVSEYSIPYAALPCPWKF